MESQSTFCYFYVISTIAGPPPSLFHFFHFQQSTTVASEMVWVCRQPQMACTQASSFQTALEEWNEGKDGRKAGGLTRRKRRRTSLQYSSSSSSSSSSWWSPIWSTSRPLNEYSSLKIDQAKIIPFLSAFHRQNIDHCLREEVYVQLHDPKPASFCP